MSEREGAPDAGAGRDARSRRAILWSVTHAFEPQAPPISEDRDGTLRVGGSRVTLDTVVGAFDAGASAEEIVERYPSLDLATVYEVIAYVLRHRPVVDEYLATRREKATSAQSTVEQQQPPHGLRAKLLARRDNA